MVFMMNRKTHFAHMFAAITNKKHAPWLTVTRPLLDRYMSVTSVTALQTLKPWIVWRSGEVLSVKCSPPPSSRPPPNYTVIKKSIPRAARARRATGPSLGPSRQTSEM